MSGDFGSTGGFYEFFRLPIWIDWRLVISTKTLVDINGIDVVNSAFNINGIDVVNASFNSSLET